MAEETEILSQVSIIGDPSAVYTIPGSAHYIDQESIREFSYDDINRTLRQVPGVYVREEDGYGLFPNISLRGVDTSRSAKVTLMEDGVLAAPAPYAAPSAYYSPTAGRMSGLEILKGSSQIKYGPHTTGGAINYLSTPIPFEQRTFLRAQYGEDNEYRTHAFHGNTIETAAGRFGFLVEGYFRGVDGFKTIDAAPGFNDREDTGFQNVEPMIKLAWEPATNIYQRVEVKYGFTDAEADETYLGLSTADFRADPNRRYSASRFDNIQREHHRSYLRYFVSPTENFDLVTTAYYNKFARNWYKLNDIRSTAGGLTANDSLSAALAGNQNGTGLKCLQGNLACGLRVRANNREYYSTGIQSEANLRFDTPMLKHELTLGVRYHKDQEDRFQQNDVYNQDSTGAISSVTFGALGSQADREDEVTALAFYMEDRIERGNLWLTPGIRFEYLELERVDYNAGTTRDGDLDLLGGGIGIGYNITSELQAFGGVHFGFSPPSPGGAINNNLEEETSTSYEIGFRYASSNQVLTAEAVGFLTEFEDLIVVNNIGGTGSGNDENFGEVESLGLELSGQFDLGLAKGWSFSNPYLVAFTYTDAEQQNNSSSTDAESIFSFGSAGNKVPYIPEYQVTLGSSVKFSRWGASVRASFVDETFTSANNVSTEVNGIGNADARFGKTDSYKIVDIAAYYEVKSDVQIFAGIQNLFEEEFIASRQPHGPRPGAPRTWYVGFQAEM
ncbi:MAG: Fe(3+) dicitrate transport protein [Gammaproteobacteria bacterium]|jgi:Fe(3+) dicitrate transport protein